MEPLAYARMCLRLQPLSPITASIISSSRINWLDRNNHAVSEIQVFVFIPIHKLVENGSFFFGPVYMVGFTPARSLNLFGRHANAWIAATLAVRFGWVGIGTVS
jgi:hypothetical protein